MVVKVKSYSKRMKGFLNESKKDHTADIFGLAMKHKVFSIFDIAESSDSYSEFKKLAKSAGFTEVQIMDARTEIHADNDWWDN